MFEVWENSAENTCKEYCGVTELFVGLVDDFEYDVYVSARIMLTFEDCNTTDYCDNDITIICKK